MKKIYLLLFVLTFFFFDLSAQNREALIQKKLNSFVSEGSFSSADVSDWVITDSHIDRRNGIEFVYISQKANGIRIENSFANFAIKDGEIKYAGNRLFENIHTSISSPVPGISPENAINNVCAFLQLTAPTGLEIAERVSKNKVVFNNGGVSLEPIPVELLYLRTDKGEIKLVWDLSIYELDAKNWWSVMIDAHSGEMLRKHNWVSQCDFGHSGTDHSEHEHSNNNLPSVESVLGGTYNVVALPAESPTHGPRLLISGQEDTLASPYGWHDTDGVAGAELTITDGNNVKAYQDPLNINNGGNDPSHYRPDGTSALLFDFPFNPSSPPNSYRDAAVTNLFYMNNMIHDVWYHYGFDEAAGNFQNNNYGRGGLGSDEVNAEAQDGGGMNNANFGTPPDGSNPRMQMYLWSGNPQKDGDFDNGIIIHEYGHGISNRLVGGASNSGGLQSAEQMGEGWSDWFGLIMTIDSGDQGSDRRGIGTFALGQTTTGTGIRPAPYSTDFNTNNYTYASTNNTSLTQPHGLGFVYCTVLWDLTWALINQYGGVPDPDLINGTGGNNIAMDLVITSLKLLNTAPGMIDGRNSILAADQLLYNGAHKCLIWDVFANRGFGWAASQGSSQSRTDQTESFLTNPYCLTPVAAPTAIFGTDPVNPVCGFEMTFVDSSLNIPQQWEWNFGDGSPIDTFARPTHIYNSPGTYTVTLKVSNTFGADSISQVVTISRPEGPNVPNKAVCEGFNAVLVPTNGDVNTQWFDSTKTLISTGPILIVNNVIQDQILFARNDPPNGNGFCVSDYDTIHVYALNGDFTYSQTGPTVNFTSLNNGVNSWLWEFGDGNTSTQENPSHNYASAGNYTVTLKVNGQCTGTQSISVVSGLNSEILSSNVRIFPNPASERVTFRLSETQNSKVKIEIKDISGKLIESYILESGQSELDIDISSYKTAVYTVRFSGKNINESQLLMIE